VKYQYNFTIKGRNWIHRVPVITIPIHKACFVKAHLVIILLLFASCTQDPDLKLPQHVEEMENVNVIKSDHQHRSISFIKDQVFIDLNNHIIGSLGSVVIDDIGRVYVADLSQKVVHVFNKNGSYLTSLGRDGFGPGEFNYISSMQINNNSIYVHDWYQKRIHVFSLNSLKFERTIMFNHVSNHSLNLQSKTLNLFFVRSDGSMLMSFSNPRDQFLNEINEFYFVDSKGRIKSERVFVEKDVRYRYQIPVMGMVVVLPFYRKSLIAMSNDDYIFKAWSEELLIQVHDSSGNYKYSLYYPYKNVKLKFDDIARSYEDTEALNAIRNAEYEEETWPALNDFIVDDEKNIWISTIVEDFDIYAWWVLENTGEVITKFEWPRNKPIEVVKNSYIYTRQTDKETGLQQIVRYRIEFEDV